MSLYILPFHILKIVRKELKIRLGQLMACCQRQSNVQGGGSGPIATSGQCGGTRGCRVAYGLYSIRTGYALPLNVWNLLGKTARPWPHRQSARELTKCATEPWARCIHIGSMKPVPALAVAQERHS